VLVLGSGGALVLGAQLAKAAGARVIATSSSKKKAEKYRALGKLDSGCRWARSARSVAGFCTEGRVHARYWSRCEGNLGGETISDLALTLLFGQVTASAVSTAFNRLLNCKQMSGILVGNKEMAERLDAFMTEHKIKPVVDRVDG
jgi:D-arabinose 1-dehydrogenase-like Zn-dependent alcohol dehydrogenase